MNVYLLLVKAEGSKLTTTCAIPRVSQDRGFFLVDYFDCYQAESPEKNF